VSTQVSAVRFGPLADIRRRLSPAELVRRGAAVWIVVLAIIIGLTIAKGEAFWAPANIAAVLTATIVLGLVSLGQHLVVLTGGIDLSVGSTATLGTLLTAVLIDGYPIRTIPVLLGVLVVGAAVGGVNGLLATRAGLPPFIVTLGMFYIVQGVALLVSSRPAGQVTSDLTSFALTRVGPVPVSFVVLVAAALLVAFLLHRTVWGRHVFAVGGDIRAARSTGINSHRVATTAYIISGVFACLAGVLIAARASIGSPTAGTGLELSAITVVVIGGASLLGGKGSLFGTLGGVLLLALITSSMTLLQMPSSWTDLIRGAVIIAAAAIFVVKTRR
jgi:ribose transport system permease protein